MQNFPNPKLKSPFPNLNSHSEHPTPPQTLKWKMSYFYTYFAILPCHFYRAIFVRHRLKYNKNFYCFIHCQLDKLWFEITYSKTIAFRILGIPINSSFSIASSNFSKATAYMPLERAFTASSSWEKLLVVAETNYTKGE